jgi:hypothetical protein
VHSNKQLRLRPRPLAPSSLRGAGEKRQSHSLSVLVLASLMTVASWASGGYSAGAVAAPGQLRPLMLGPNYAPSTISCSASRCTFAGSTPNGATFVGTLDPLSRALRVLHVGKASGANVNALVCPTGLLVCIAAGSAGIGFTEPINATTGALGPIKPVPGTLGFDAVACPSTAQCWLGGYEGKYPNFTSVFVPSAPSGATGRVSKGPTGQGLAVACPRAASCLGLVSSSTSSEVVVLKAATIVASHPVSRALHLACASAVDCFAVGFGDVVPLNGATGVPGPSSPLPYKQAQGIACPSPAECVVAGYTRISASGSNNTSALSVLVHGHPAETRALELPGSAGVNALSCSSPTLCWVIGYGTKGGFVDPVDVAP